MGKITKKNINKKCEQWFEKIKNFNRSSLKLNPDKSALLVIDMQNYFLDFDGKAFLENSGAIIQNVKSLIQKFRDMNRPIVFTKHVHKEDGSDAGIMGWWWSKMIVEGTKDSELFEEFKPLKNEKIILKNKYSAFYDTDLQRVLARQGVEDIVITGVMTNLCVESTIRDAYYRDYRVFLPLDATTSSTEEMHLSSLINLAYGFACIVTTDGVLKQLKPSR